MKREKCSICKEKYKPLDGTTVFSFASGRKMCWGCFASYLSQQYGFKMRGILFNIDNHWFNQGGCNLISGLLKGKELKIARLSGGNKINYYEGYKW